MNEELSCSACGSDAVNMDVSEDGDHFVCQCSYCGYEWFEEILAEDEA